MDVLWVVGRWLVDTDGELNCIVVPTIIVSVLVIHFNLFYLWYVSQLVGGRLVGTTTVTNTNKHATQPTTNRSVVSDDVVRSRVLTKPALAIYDGTVNTSRDACVCNAVSCVV